MLEVIPYFARRAAGGGYAPLARNEAFFVVPGAAMLFALGASPDGSVLMQQAGMAHASVSGARLVMPSNGTTAASSAELAAFLRRAEVVRVGTCFLAREALLATEASLAEARAVNAASRWGYSGGSRGAASLEVLAIEADAVGGTADSAEEAGREGAKKRR